MNTFKYINGSLHCEEVDLSLIGERYATPSYVYSKKTIEENAKAYVNSFTNTKNLACFAVKSLSNLSILKIIKDAGCGLILFLVENFIGSCLLGQSQKKLFFLE